MLLSITPTSQDATYITGSGYQSIQNVVLSGNSDTSATASYQFLNTSVNWLSVVNITPFSGGTATATIMITEADLLPGTNYVGKIYFTDETGFPFVHTVNLTKQDPLLFISTDQQNYSVVYNRLTNTLSGDTLVSILHNTGAESLNFETVGTLFLEKTATDNFTLVQDPAFPFSTNSELPQSGTKVVTCKLKRNSGSTVASFTVTINIVNTNDITVDPAILNFTQYKHLSETKTEILKLINPGSVNFSMVYPAFLNASPTSGNGSADITVTTENSMVLAAQTYKGDIEISYASKLLKIPVILNNVDFIDFLIGDHNFCLDNIILSVQRMTDIGKFVRIGLEITMQTAEGNFTANPSYQIAYFNNQAETNIGKKIQNYFPIFGKHIFENSTVEFNNIFVYKPANVTLTIDELDANYDVTFTRKIENIKFYPGKKPKMFPLFTNSSLKRIYSNTTHLFSYLTTLVDPSDIVGKTVSTNPFSTDEINSVFFEDSNGLMDFGDYKSVLGVDFLKMQKGDQQIFVQFINQNLVPEMAVFNGFYVIEDDYTHTYDDFEVNAQKYDSKVIGKATLNTGFIFKEEAAMVGEIAKSRLAFVKIGEEIFKCLPIPGKIEKVNSENNLVIFELEFLIVE